jgi:hypothetical protein
VQGKIDHDQGLQDGFGLGVEIDGLSVGAGSGECGEGGEGKQRGHGVATGQVHERDSWKDGIWTSGGLYHFLDQGGNGKFSEI